MAGADVRGPPLFVLRWRQIFQFSLAALDGVAVQLLQEWDDVLRQAHSPTARAVVVVTNNDLVNLEVALLVRGK